MRMPDDVGRDFTEVRRCSGWRRHGAIGGHHTRLRELVEMLNDYFEIMVDTIFKYEGSTSSWATGSPAR